jgi:cyclopropane fatty-acyl-phospholipid synthase-like methyltransferase
MANTIAERLVWAVETLAVAPNDHLLEIGCGHGVAVSLVCEKLAGGTITAIDRSATMIEMAARRNRAQVASGKAFFQTVVLDQADLGHQRFNKIFAINVNVFWMQPARELAVVRRHLAPRGAFYLIFEPPVRQKSREIADRLTTILPENGYQIREVLFADLQKVSAVCIIAG